MPASGWPRLRFITSRMPSPIAVEGAVPSSRSTQSKLSMDAFLVSFDLLTFVSSLRAESSARPWPKLNADKSNSLSSRGNRSIRSFCSAALVSSKRDTCSNSRARLRSSVCFSSPFESRIPFAMAARFWSFASRRGSAICIDALPSTSIPSTRRMLPSTVNASTGRSSSAISSARNTTRSAASVYRRHGATVTGVDL